jgi:hypothetical protein
LARRFDYTQLIHERWGIEDHVIVMAWNLFLRVLAISELGLGTPQQLQAAKAAFVEYMRDRALEMRDEEELERGDKFCIAHRDREDQVLHLVDQAEVKEMLSRADLAEGQSG